MSSSMSSPTLNHKAKMFILPDDMSELRRIAANTYEQEKSEQILRIIRGINKMESAVATLKAENDRLKKADQ